LRTGPGLSEAGIEGRVHDLHDRIEVAPPRGPELRHRRWLDAAHAAFGRASGARG
jgi:hypothetical protein